VCKFSGLVTEAGSAEHARLAPCVEHLLDVFGPARLMWGSDWPVLELNGDYLLWHSVANTLLSSLADSEREAIFGGNAAAFYRL